MISCYMEFFINLSNPVDLWCQGKWQVQSCWKLMMIIRGYIVNCESMKTKIYRAGAEFKPSCIAWETLKLYFQACSGQGTRPNPDYLAPKMWLSLRAILCCTVAHAHPLTSCLHSSVQFWPDFKAQRGLPGSSVVKNLLASARDVEDMGLIPGSERSPVGSSGNPILLLENPIYKRAWQATVHGSQRVEHDWPHTHRVQRVYLELRACLPHRHLRSGRALLISKESIFNKLYYS